MILTALGFCFLWFVSTPTLLHHAGVIEKNPNAAVKDAFDEFISATVQPAFERGLNAIHANFTNAYITEERLRPGFQLRNLGAVAKYPIVIVPGFVTSGLELWGGEECAKKHFRQRFWGSVSMARTFFSDRECWRRHLTLDPYTGGDPPNVRLRASQGFEAADYFMATYWVWSKLIENLADVGYDGSLMTMMSYDWRLAYPMLEKRDGYFTKLRYTIEAFHRSTGEKVVLMSHSMGGTVVYYFLQWVCEEENNGGGGGGSDWVEKHVHSFVNIAGTLLGVPKAVPALLSGELKDTAAMLSQLGSLLEQYFGKRLRRNLWNTWGSLFGMLPKGGDAIWSIGADMYKGNGTDLEPDIAGTGPYPLVTWNDTWIEGGKSNTSLSRPPRMWSTEETIDYLLKTGGGYGPKLSSSRLYSFEDKHKWGKMPRKEQWHSPIAAPLPKSPSLKIYCMYGTGISTERSYFYKNSCDKSDCSDSDPSQREEDPGETTFTLDTSVNDKARNITYGVRFSDGDGSVPLISLGYMCQKWREGGRHNPSGAKVIIREHRHQGEFSASDPGRGGRNSGEHVDILGNIGLMRDVVKVVTGFETSTVDESIIVSDLERVADKIGSYPQGGLKETPLIDVRDEADRGAMNKFSWRTFPRSFKDWKLLKSGKNREEDS